jgi:hypothetical protein
MLGLPEFGGDRLEDRKNAPAGRVSFGEDEITSGSVSTGGCWITIRDNCHTSKPP